MSDKESLLNSIGSLSEFVLGVDYFSSDNAVFVEISSDIYLSDTCFSTFRCRVGDLLAESGIEVSVIPVVVKSESFKKGIKVVFDFLNLFLDYQFDVGFDDGGCVLYLDEVLSEEEFKSLSAKLKKAFLIGGLKFSKLICRHHDAIFPSDINLLALVKVLQPVKVDFLFVKLLDRFSGVSVDWLKRELDRLRKKGFLVSVGVSDGVYSLTEKGVHIIPVTYRSTSSDVKRALELGKKIW